VGTGSCEGFNEVRREGILKRRQRGFARKAPVRSDRCRLDSYPFEFSWKRFGEDIRRADLPKATEKCPIRFNASHFWAAYGFKGLTAHDGPQGKRQGRARKTLAHFVASGSGDDDDAKPFWCSERHLQLQVVVPALTRT